MASRPLAIGIHWAHDASVSICSPQGVLFSIQEERLTRIKHHYGFPRQALELALKYCGLTGKDIDFVAFSTWSVFYPEHSNYVVVSTDGTPLPPKVEAQADGWRAWIRQNILEEFGWTKAEDKAATRKQADDLITASWGEFADRHYRRHREFLGDLGLMDERIRHYYVAHHRAHASSAFRLSGATEACVITMDGKGDGLSATISRGYADGRLELLRSTPAQDSLGSFYQATTEALGFIPVDGEYKTMGLAAFGKPEDGRTNPFEGTVQVEDGVFKSSKAWTFRSYNDFNLSKQVPNPLSSVSQSEEYKKVLEGMPREQFAYYAQVHCEANILDYVRDALRITGQTTLAAAGGVMLNVKANALIRDKLKPARYFVFPDSADSGLAAGAAMEALYQAGAVKGQAHFKIPYLGHDFTDDRLYAAIQDYDAKHKLIIQKYTPAELADRLCEGRVIGTFQGRLEMGPRALGNRSVLADPRSPAMKDRINLILKGREWFVPFAPMVLEEDAHLYWDGPIDYRYMTFAVQGTDYAKATVPAVVHTDGTLRPQVVSADFNAWIYDLICQFKQRTDVGVLLNTSFNRHGLPIVGSPQDALEHLVNGWVDALAIGPWYVERRP